MTAARVLVVDHDVDSATLIQHLAADSGYAVAVAHGTEVALELAAETRFDLVVTDLGAGGSDWWELIRRLRELVPPPGIIAITAFGSFGFGARALEAGASAYLRKPFHADELAERMRQVLQRRAIRLRNERLRDEVDQFRRGLNDSGRKR
jgi:DNA-binding response OmpR family regulator